MSEIRLLKVLFLIVVIVTKWVEALFDVKLDTTTLSGEDPVN